MPCGSLADAKAAKSVGLDYGDGWIIRIIIIIIIITLYQSKDHTHQTLGLVHRKKKEKKFETK